MFLKYFKKYIVKYLFIIKIKRIDFAENITSTKINCIEKLIPIENYLKIVIPSTIIILFST
jgi:hypothetical protein